MLWWQCIVSYNTVIIIEKHQETYGNTIDTNQMIYETKFKVKITGNTPNTDDKKNVEIAVTLKYLSNFWRTLEMLLINYEINLILSWSEDCVISSANGRGYFKIKNTKIYVPVATLSTQDYAKLLQATNQYLDFLIDRSFQGVNRFFVLSFENEGDRKIITKYYLSKVEIKNFKVIIWRKNFFWSAS